MLDCSKLAGALTLSFSASFYLDESLHLDEDNQYLAVEY